MRQAVLLSILMFCNGLTQAYQDWIQSLALSVVRYKFISLLLWNVWAWGPSALDTVLLQKGSASRRNNSRYKAWISIYAKFGEETPLPRGAWPELNPRLHALLHLQHLLNKRNSALFNKKLKKKKTKVKFLGASAIFRKATINLVIFFCPSVRPHR